MLQRIQSSLDLCGFILIVLLGFGAPTAVRAQPPVEEVLLYFPDVIHTNELQTGIALANQSDTAATVILYFIHEDGTVIQPNLDNPVVRNIGPGEQIAEVLPDIFGQNVIGQSGLVVAQSNNVAVVGFFLTFDPAIGAIDGADALVSPITRTGNSFLFQGGLSTSGTIFQEVLTGAGSTNKIVVLALTGGNPANGTLELIRNGSSVETEQINFPGSEFLISRWVGTLEETFDTPLQATDYVRASSPRPLTGYQSFGRSKFTAGRNAVRQPTTNRRDNAIFGAQLAVTPAINTFLKVVNPTGNTMNLKIEAFPTGPGAAGVESAGAAASREVVLSPRSAIREDLSTFLNLSNFQGWLRIDSDRTGLLANASFGDSGGNFLSSVELQASPQRELVNSHVANGFGFGTGLTFLNPFPDSGDVEIEVFDKDGNRTGGGNLTLGGFEHKPILISQIDPGLASQVGGFIEVNATRGIFSFELFFYIPPGMGSVTSLSAVPPQRGNGFLEGVLTPVEPPASLKQAAGSPPRIEYRASAARGVRLDPAWDFRPGEIIVKMRSSATAALQADSLQALDLRVHRQAPEQVLLLRSNRIETPDPGRMAQLASTPRMMGMKLATLDLIERLNSHPDVEYAQPNYLVQAQGIPTPNDPLYDLQWHYPFISLDLAWQITTGDPNLVVAVIDTGAKFAHPDLDGRLTGGQFDFIDDPQIAADGDGIDGSAEDPGDDPLNPTYHGTHVAGTIGAKTNNGVGVAGGNWDSKLMILRALGVGGGSTFDIMQAARYAARLSNTSGGLPTVRASVINLSLGSRRSCSLFEMQNLNQVMAQGVVVVVAAGNSNTADDFAPASCPGVINVGAIGPSGTRAPYSNFGPRITGVAPGGNLAGSFFDGILSTMWDADSETPIFDYKQGTSMATPHVAAIVSLMLSVNPSLTPAQVKTILEDTAIDLGEPGRDDLTGVGRFDAFRAVAAAAGSNLADPILAVDSTFLDFGNSLDSLGLTLTNIGGGTLNVSSIVPQTDSGGPWLSVDLNPPAAVLPAGATSALIAVLVDRTGLADGEYTGEVVITSDGGTIGVKVRMVVGANLIPDVGELIVLAIDPRTLQTAAGFATDVDAGYAYRFQVQAGEYNILASTDHDNDNFICEEEDLCGWFPVDSDPSEVQILAGQTLSGVDFLVRPRGGFNLGAGPFPGGFQIPSWLRDSLQVSLTKSPPPPQ